MAPVPRTSITGNFNKLKDFMDNLRSFFLKLARQSVGSQLLYLRELRQFSLEDQEGSIGRQYHAVADSLLTNRKARSCVSCGETGRLIQVGRYFRSVQMDCLGCVFPPSKRHQTGFRVK